MQVADYSRLTGLLRNSAAKELKQWAENPENGIATRGAASHKVYVRRKETD